LVVVSRKPKSWELDSIKLAYELRKKSPEAINEEAKSLVTLGATLLTAYTGALNLFKIPEDKIYFLRISDGLEYYVSFKSIMLLIPIIFWILSIAFNVWVYFPKEYRPVSNSPNRIEEEFSNMISTKYSRLKRGAIFFVLALSGSAICLGLTGVISTTGPVSVDSFDVQFIIAESQMPIFQNLGIDLEGSSLKTVPVTLLETNNLTYKVQLLGGRTADIRRDQVAGVIYLTEIAQNES